MFSQALCFQDFHEPILLYTLYRQFWLKEVSYFGKSYFIDIVDDTQYLEIKNAMIFYDTTLVQYFDPLITWIGIAIHVVLVFIGLWISNYKIIQEEIVSDSLDEDHELTSKEIEREVRLYMSDDSDSDSMKRVISNA